MFLEIVTPAKKVFEGEVTIATFPGVDGSFQVMNDHAPLISTLREGKVVYKDKSGAHQVIITGGVVEVLNNKAVLLADGLEGEVAA
ncbi:MAG: FoF1 ATP synthase subunit delta/epsilon [Candidatus Cyclobacteriaceae bacterium M2_1C_046]